MDSKRSANVAANESRNKNLADIHFHSLRANFDLVSSVEKSQMSGKPIAVDISTLSVCGASCRCSKAIQVVRPGGLVDLLFVQGSKTFHRGAGALIASIRLRASAASGLRG